MGSGRYFYIPLSVFLLGVLLGIFTDFGFAFPTLFLLLGVSVAIYRYISDRTFSAQTLFVPIVLILFALGIVRVDLAQQTESAHIFDDSIGQEVYLEGIVVEEPDAGEWSQRLTVDVENPNGRANTKVLATVDLYPEFQYGDRLSLAGKIELPESFETDTGRTFNYPAFLAKEGIYYQLFYPDIEKVGEGEGNIIKEKLFAFKRAFLESISLVIPEPHVSLLGGLVVGAEESLGDELIDDLRTTGIIHIVVLSGYNITIVAESIMRLFSFLPQAASVSLGGAAIVLFAIMTGATATIVRASIMAVLVLLARLLDRPYAITRALVLTGVVMVLHNPLILVYDPSFQLSFLATLGLILVAPHIDKALGFVSQKWQVKEFVVATIATQIFVLPLLLYMSGELSFVALPVNVLVLIFVPLTMLVGFIAGMLGFISATIALPFAYASFALLAYELKVVDVFASLPFASVSVPQISIWLVVLVYGLYTLGLFYLHKRTSPTYVGDVPAKS